MVAPGCTKRLPLSGSTKPAAILSSVDLPEPLRPIRQTRSAGDTESSTPDNSGVPPNVSLMSFNWISGGAMISALMWRRLLRPLALDAADGLIERGQECRAVARRKGFRPAGDFARGAQVCHQVAHRQGHADRLFGEGFSVRRDHFGACLHAAACQRNIRGDHDIALAGAFRDPADWEPVSDGDAVDLVLYRAGIGVDKNTGGMGSGCHAARVVLHSCRNCEQNAACQDGFGAYDHGPEIREDLRHDQSARTLPRLGLQQLKAVREQDPRRHRGAPVRVFRRARPWRRRAGLYAAPSRGEMGPGLPRARPDRGALPKARL